MRLICETRNRPLRRWIGMNGLQCGCNGFFAKERCRLSFVEAGGTSRQELAKRRKKEEEDDGSVHARHAIPERLEIARVAATEHKPTEGRKHD